MARHGGATVHLRERVPFPTQQMAVLALCRICEPIAFMSIFPYTVSMVKSFGIGQTDTAQINVYVGMVTSAFAFAECASSVFWGRLSDRIGRKKVLLGGLFGTGLSMLLFGFSSSLPVALFARAVGGLLNGNIGVLQTTVGELVTEERHQPRAYSIMPFIWCLGTIIGSSLGGILAKPADTWSLFEGTIFETFPYLLPNVVCTAVVVLGLIVGLLFLEETHEDLKFEQDWGREVGQWILHKVWSRRDYMQLSDKDESLDEFRCMLEGHTSRAYRSTDSSPTLCSSRTSIAAPPPFSLEQDSEPTPTIRDAFTKQICLNIAAVGFLAFHTISLEQMLPVLMAHDIRKPNDVVQLPFKFLGGFGYTSQKMGVILSVQGVLQMIAQVILFPWISKKLGNLRTFWLTIVSYPLLYFIGPYLALLPEKLRVPGIFFLLVWKVTAQSLSYPSLNIMLRNSAPSKKVLGTLNGAAASSASICRGFGPMISGAIGTLGESLGLGGLAWWACAIIAIIAWIPAAFMEENRKRPGLCGNEEDEEVGLGDELEDDSSDTDSVLTLSPTDMVEVVLSK